MTSMVIAPLARAASFTSASALGATSFAANLAASLASEYTRWPAPATILLTSAQSTELGAAAAAATSRRCRFR